MTRPRPSNVAQRPSPSCMLRLAPGVGPPVGVIELADDLGHIEHVFIRQPFRLVVLGYLPENLVVTPLHIHADAFFRPGFRLCRIRPHACPSLPTKPSSPECAPPRPPKAQIPASVPSITPPLRGSRQGAAEPVGGETAVRLDAAKRPCCRTGAGIHAPWPPTGAFGDSPPARHSRESGNPVMVSSSINLPPLEGESANQGRSLQIFRWGKRRPFGLTRRSGLVAGQGREPMRHGFQQEPSGTRPRSVIPACLPGRRTGRLKHAPEGFYRGRE